MEIVKNQSNEFTLEDNLVACAQRLSKRIEESFMYEMGACVSFIKAKHGNIENPQSLEKLKIATEIMLEYLYGTAVAISSELISADKEIEEKTILLIKDKFARLRSIKNEHNKA